MHGFRFSFQKNFYGRHRFNATSRIFTLNIAFVVMSSPTVLCTRVLYCILRYHAQNRTSVFSSLCRLSKDSPSKSKALFVISQEAYL
jgi:hypothetical protein